MNGKPQIVIERKNLNGYQKIWAQGNKSAQPIGWFCKTDMMVFNCNYSKRSKVKNVKEAKSLADRFAKDSEQHYIFQNHAFEK
jgi:hypothetical protein